MISSPDRIAIIGTGLIGTSIALASARVGCSPVGWDVDTVISSRSSGIAGFPVADTFEDAVADAAIVVVCAPVPEIPDLVARALAAAPEAVVTDVASVKSWIVERVAASVPAADRARFVAGHPMGGSERSGPEHASASVVDGIVWVTVPGEEADAAATEGLEAWIRRIGAKPVRMSPERHDRLVAFVSHLPQVASSALMSLVATEEADEPEILLLAAGGFRDLTRLAASNPVLWSEILLSNRDAVTAAIDLYVRRLTYVRDQLRAEHGTEVERVFDEAKLARLRLSAKPQVRSGVAVLQVGVPDRPGALAEITAVLGQAGVNIEDLQIVHSPEGGRGTVHLTVAAEAAGSASDVMAANDFDPIRLA